MVQMEDRLRLQSSLALALVRRPSLPKPGIRAGGQARERSRGRGGGKPYAILTVNEFGHMEEIRLLESVRFRRVMRNVKMRSRSVKVDSMLQLRCVALDFTAARVACHGALQETRCR